MSAAAIIPHEEERKRDELCLTVLNCFEDGWTFGEIAQAVAGVTRCAALGIVHRINAADPDALARKPGNAKPAWRKGRVDA